MPIQIKNEGHKAKYATFAAALGKTEDEVAAALKSELGDTIDDAAVTNLGDPEITPDADLLAALTGAGVAKATARAAIKGIRNAPAPSATVESPAPVRSNGVLAGTPLLVTPADNISLLELLRVGGVAKMTPEDLLAALRGAYTRSVGVGEIIPELLKRMKKHAESLDEPLGQTYFKLLKASRRRQYADVLAAFDGAITSVPEDEKQAFLDKVDTLWAPMSAFQGQLDAYRQLHKDESGDVGNIVAAIRLGSSAVEYPDPTPVVSAARGLIDRFNRVFGGMGIPCARTVAKDVTDEAELLRNPELPGTVGAGSFEEMIRKLELAVPSDVSTQEALIAKFALNILKLPDITPDSQPEFILQLQRVGKSITTWPTPRTRTATTPTRGGGRDGNSGRWGEDGPNRRT